MKEYDEDNIMHFGKYRGQRLGDIPADYLIWLWNKGFNAKHWQKDDDGRLSRWIEKQIPFLEKECPDKIIDRKV